MKQADRVCSRMFRGMTKQEVTSLGDCSALVHYKDNPSWQYDPPSGPWSPSLSALIQDQGFSAGAQRCSNLCGPSHPLKHVRAEQGGLLTKASSSRLVFLRKYRIFLVLKSTY